MTQRIPISFEQSGKSFSWNRVRRSLILFGAANLCIFQGCSTLPSAKPSTGLPATLTTSAGAFQLQKGAPTLVSVVRQQDASVAKNAGKAISDADFVHRRIRSVTVIDFAGALPAAFQKITLAKIDSDLRKASARLQGVYADMGVDRNPLEDLHVVADFDGSVARSLGSTGADPRILLIDGNGKILRVWSRAPSAAELKSALATTAANSRT